MVIDEMDEDISSWGVPNKVKEECGKLLMVNLKKSTELE